MPKLVVRAPNHLGDCVMALPAIGALRDLFRDSAINVIAPEFVAGLFKRHPSVDHVLSLRDGAHHGFRSISATRKALRETGEDFEIGILLTDSLSSATAFRLAGVTKVYGYAGNGRQMALSATLSESATTIHRSERYQNLVSFAALRFWENPYWVKHVSFERPEIYFSDVERSAAGAVLERKALVGASPETRSQTSSSFAASSFVAIAPQAVAESRRWGAENYGELAGLIVSELGLRIALMGSKAEHEAGELVRSLAGENGVINLCGVSRIRGTAAFLERAVAFVGNDSGLAHLAALVNIPLVVLSGADNPAETSPFSERKTVIEKTELDCIHCVKNTCPRSGDDHMRCMRLISVADVFSELKAILTR